MVNISFFGGVSEIGGNKIQLEEKGSKIFLDFGMSFSKESLFFEFPLLRPSNKEDLFKLNLLPNIPGLYQNQGFYPKYYINGTFEVEGTEQSRGIDAIFLSHAHMDHYGYIGLLRDDIPIYMSKVTKKLIELRTNVGNVQWNTKIDNLILNDLEKNKELQIKDYSIKRYDVDHSILGAASFIIKIKNQTIAYTGDFRFHGYRGNLTEEFIKAMKNEHIDILITEGTRIPKPRKSGQKIVESHNLDKEEEVFNKCVDIISKEDKLVIYDCSPADIDRLRTMWKVAQKTGRKLVVDSKKAYLILYINAQKKLIDDLPQIGDFLIYLNRLKFRSGGAYKKLTMGHNIYAESFEYYHQKHEGELTVKQQMESKMKTPKDLDAYKKQYNNPNLIEINDDNLIWGPLGRQKIRDSPNEYIIITSNGMQTMLQFKKDNKGLEGTYIYGKAEPFNEEMILSFKRLQNWLRICNLKLEYSHSSGHLGYDDMKKVLEDFQPDMIFPIHTEKPEVFKEFTKKKNHFSTIWTTLLF